MITPDVIGYAAGIINMCHLAPQLVKSFRSKSTGDISLGYAAIHVVGLSLWAVYGVLIMSWPVIIMHTIETLLAVYLLYLKIRYG